ncbi:hypothetical protein [Niallia sp. Marseille-Q9988]
MLDLTEPIKEENYYFIKREFATTPAFEISYKMNEEYYDKKILQHLNGENVGENSSEV